MTFILMVKFLRSRTLLVHICAKLIGLKTNPVQVEREDPEGLPYINSLIKTVLRDILFTNLLLTKPVFNAF